MKKFFEAPENALADSLIPTFFILFIDIRIFMVYNLFVKMKASLFSLPRCTLVWLSTVIAVKIFPIDTEMKIATIINKCRKLLA